jgi:DNA-binding CsgD family transcriptional regulator
MKLRGEPPPSLTYREYHVLAYAAKGRSLSEIADDLGLSYYTVRHFHYDALRKLDAHNQTEAFRAMGWLKPPDEEEIERYGQGGRLIAEIRRLARIVRQTERSLNA